jgi:hypothetical protein
MLIETVISHSINQSNNDPSEISCLMCINFLNKKAMCYEQILRSAHGKVKIDETLNHSLFYSITKKQKKTIIEDVYLLTKHLEVRSRRKERCN